VLFGGE
jgi:WD40 repeat protein